LQAAHEAVGVEVVLGIRVLLTKVVVVELVVVGKAVAEKRMPLAETVETLQDQIQDLVAVVAMLIQQEAAVGHPD
jgi:hypothetical protein